MAKRQSLYPSNLDTNLNWGSQEGLEVDRQPEDRFTSDSWDLMESAILALERQGMGFAHSIWDTDLDTGIDTEAAADEDIIRFYTGTPKTEQAKIDDTIMSIAEDLAHLGDADTYIRFPAAGDTIQVVVGLKAMIDITEVGAADNTFIINEGAQDVNFRIEGVGAPNAFFSQGSDGKIGMGLAVIPKAGIGAAILALEGADLSVDGPHVQFTTASDDYPLLSIYPYGHDNVQLLFDAYWGDKSSDAGSNYRFIKSTDLLKIQYDSGIAQGGAIAWNDGIVLDTSGKVFINDTANAFALGPSLTIDGEGQDGEYFTLQDSTDVAHGMTDFTETASFLTISKVEDAAGGAEIAGWKDADGVAGHALFLGGRLGEAADTTKTTAGIGVITLDARVKLATGVTGVGANGNLVVIRNSSTCRFIFDAEGSGHADVEWVAFDKHDDLALLSDFETAMLIHQDKIKGNFVDFLQYKRDDLEEAKIAHFDDDNPGHAMVNFTRLHMLEVGAIGQIGDRLSQVDDKLATYERAFEKISQKLGIPKQELLALGN